MFICKKCLGENWIGLAISYGPCECCGEVTECDDYPSKYLPKDWHSNYKHAEKKLEDNLTY